MAGTKAGAAKAVQTIYKKHGKDFFVKTGAIGGKLAPGPFRADRELARRAGAIGGRNGRRGLAQKTIDKERAEFQEGIGEPGWIKRVTKSPEDKLRAWAGRRKE